MRNFVPLECLRTIYFAIVHSCINYGIEVYANTYYAHIDKLVKLNNRLLRIILNKPWMYPQKELYKSFNILPINKQHELSLLKMTHRIFYNSNVPDVFQNYFTTLKNKTSYSFRNETNLEVKRCNSTFGQRNLKYKCSTLWKIA